MPKQKCLCGREHEHAIEDSVDILIVLWGCVLEHYPSLAAGCPVPVPPLTVADQSSALCSLLLNLCVRELQRGHGENGQYVRDEMLRMAYRLELLAHTDIAQLEAVAQYLSDTPREAISRQ